MIFSETKETKRLEIKDGDMCISVRATYTRGKPDSLVFVTHEPSDTPHKRSREWNRATHVVYNWLKEHWDETQSGQVIDVQHILFEPK
jgi:hypothetical protein